MSSDATTITTLDSTGRVVLPAEVRKQLRLVTGARFSVDVVADRIELTLEVPPTAGRGPQGRAPRGGGERRGAGRGGSDPL
jgi:AbrB family looped-hinge helix DNA binding protein